MSIIPLRKVHAPSYGSSRVGDFDRLFDSLFRNALSNISAVSPSLTDLSLRMDVSETDKAYTITAELPGLDEKEVDISVTDGILTIAGEKKQESEEEGKTFHRVERHYGSFRRALTLPADADENNITAKMKNGILAVEIAKVKEAEKPVRKIEVRPE